ncbi:hypothetical protein Mp_7g17140 [Marchantia polymorpha subsp. ruderalis]|uniref:Uncharacterized protein n=2 Tax=Marchantia polymorpha TaxID=3197 RepID=A0AAF6C0N9_MARPO|nr:hypothetical protein MARPO_0051s0051 [Marchantia polymorpha]BBN17823.1 hypothetical protein Mp_7g17140 [Marchantia polymorpha subsp. ruderalis]|eukprot:PTQ38448.1 hypothetical protein MARPO_0051s0051 [Marchantia polymorpha]
MWNECPLGARSLWEMMRKAHREAGDGAALQDENIVDQTLASQPRRWTTFKAIQGFAGSAQQLIRDPKLFVDSTFVQPAKQPAERKKPEDKHKPIVMNVSICCSSCVDLLEPELLAVKG